MTLPSAIPAPPPLGRRLLRYILGFGVGFVAGLAPFLGRVKIPGFSSLLEVYPVQMRENLSTFSGFLLGTIAVAVQFYAAKVSPSAILERYFRSLLIGMLGAFAVLVILYFTTVVSVPIGDSHYTVLVTWFRVHSDDCRCAAGSSELQCVEELSLNPAILDTCWRYLPFFRLLLTLPCFVLLGGFGALVGLLLLREEEEWRLKRLQVPEPDPAPTEAAARPKLRPKPKAKANAGAKPKPSPGPRKRPSPRRGGPPSPPEGPPEA